MLYLVFDLDHTLYQMEDFSYDKLKRNPYLKFLLDMISYKKLIFTNGTLGHAQLCLNLIDISDKFGGIVARDTIKDLKPFKSSYEKFIQVNNILPNDYVFFFEDSLDNLEMAKRFGWITFYIGPQSQTHLPFVDMSFKSIEDNLEYFIAKKT